MIQTAKYILILLLIFPSALHAQNKIVAFPGAEGYGRFTTGGRGGEILIINNLNDSGEGSFRAAIEKEGPRIIIFNVSGNIELKSPLKITNGDVTIAGQSAPGDGITIKGYPVDIDADNVILRFLRFRLGDENMLETDALGGRQQKNLIIDHCSVSWSVDECASFYPNENFTLQWSIISESLNSSAHKKGEHGYGGIWGGNYATFHHNLLAHHKSRNPRFSGASYDYDIPNKFLDYRNNVIYNWGANSAYGNELGEVNMINNYYKPGPATSKSSKNRIIQPSEPLGKYYISGNYVVGDEKVSKNNWDGGVHTEDLNEVFQEKEYASAAVNTHTAEEAYELVLSYAGASLRRDAVDNRIIKEAKEGTATYKGSKTGMPGIIDSQNDVGGWPVLQTETPKPDRDKDGMPDEWEMKYKLNPDDPSDAKGRQLNRHYDNIEVYLNELVRDIINGQKGNAGVFNQPYEKEIRTYDFIVDASGNGDFKTVQEAIMDVPDLRKNETRIFIKNGSYKEKLILPASKTNVTFIGEDVEKTIITYDDYASRVNRFGEEIGTSGSSGFYVFGEGFTAKNITFENSAGPVGQTVAVRIDGDKVTFENCKFLGYQDTLYPHGQNSRQYYKDCYIEGTTDFIFGWSTAVFENCTIHSKKGGSYITAASTTEDTKYGFVFINCTFTADEGVEGIYLGRPWRDHAQTVIINSVLGDHINPEGWHNWNKAHAEKTAFYAEYNSKGPGADPEKRVKWSHQLNEEEIKKFTVEKIFDGWMPSTIENKNKE